MKNTKAEQKALEKLAEDTFKKLEKMFPDYPYAEGAYGLVEMLSKTMTGMIDKGRAPRL